MGSLLKFLVELATLTIILLPVNYYVLEEILNIDFNNLHYFVFTYLIIMVSIIQFTMMKSIKNRPQRFVFSFMSSMGIKIFISLFILVVIMYSGINNSKPFAINFLALYISYSTFSVLQILRLQKKVPEDK